MPGYGCRFRSSLKRGLCCPMCRLPMKDPVKISTCGHRFCDTCLQDYLRCAPSDGATLPHPDTGEPPQTSCSENRPVTTFHSQARSTWFQQVGERLRSCSLSDEDYSTEAHREVIAGVLCYLIVMPLEREGVFTCPEDNLPLDYAKVYPDPDAEVAIMGSMVYCIHYKDGCKWSDELRKLQGHLNMCKFDAIPCTNLCGAMIPRLLMEDHLLYTCPKRRTRCEYCSRDFTGATLETHVGTCQFEPIYCENKCGSKVQRRFMSNHRVHECTKRLIPCRYCQKEFVYDTLQNHTAKCPRFPMPCPNRCDVMKIPREDLESHLSDHCSALTLTCAFKDMGCKFKGSRSAVDQHQEEATKAHLTLVCGLVSRQQHQISALRSTLQGLCLNTTGTLLWKVSDYSRRMADAKDGYELCSAPFYTSQHGYKLMATLFLYGNGAGEGTHISIYIKILPGEYDALLPWPFSHTVTFVLYDQVSGSDISCNVIESFVPDPTWKNFQRPSKEPDALGFGFPRFVSHETLKKRNYIKDDVMFIKVKVDGSKIIAV